MNWSILTISFLITALLFCQTNGATTEISPTTTSIAVKEFLSEQNGTSTDANTTVTTTESPPTTTELRISTTASPHQNLPTTEISPTTTSIAVKETLSEQNGTSTDANTTDTTTERPPTTTELRISTTASPHPNLLETTSTVYVQSDSSTKNGLKYGADVTTDKNTNLVSPSSALNDVSQGNKITTEIPQGQTDTHLTIDRFSQKNETTTELSVQLTTEMIDKTIESSSSKDSTSSPTSSRPTDRPSTGTSTTRRNTPSEYLYVETKDTIGRSIHPGASSERSGVVIIGAVLAFFCVAILVAVGLVFRRRRQNEKQKVMMNFDLNRMDLRSIRHQPPNVVTVNFPLRQEADFWQDVKPMNASVI